MTKPVSKILEIISFMFYLFFEENKLLDNMAPK